MSKPRDERQKDLFRPALDQIIDMRHPLVLLAEKIDWSFIDERFRSVCHEGPGQPPLATVNACVHRSRAAHSQARAQSLG